MTDPTPSLSAHPEAQPTPKRLRLHTAWLIVSWALVFALIYGSLANIHLPVHPQEELLKILIDKGKHFAAYFLLMFLFANIYYFNNRRQLAYLAFLSLLGYGLEYGQGLTDYRSFDYGDLNANLWGIALAFAICLTPAFQLLRQFEKKIYGRTISS